MKSWRVVVVMLMLVCATLAMAQQVSFSASSSTLTIAVFEGKTYLVRTSPGKVPTFESVTITYLSLDTGPTPPDPPDPPPTVLTARAKAVQQAALSVVDPARADHAAGLATAYAAVAEKIRSGSVTSLTGISSALREAADKYLGSISMTTQWKPVRDVLTAYLTTLAQEGASDAQYAALIDEAVLGLKAVR